MATWELEHNATRQTFAAWGITSHTLRRVSLAADTLELTVETSDALTVAPWAYEDTIEVFKDSTRYFKGQVAVLPRRGIADAHSITYRIEGPWRFLEQTTFQQGWGQINSGETAIEQVQRARVLMGMADNGSLLATGAQISAILQYAIDNGGADYTIGTVLTGVNAWTSDSTGETCADVIRKLMGWSPKEVSYFDYSTATPTLHIGALPSSIAIDTATENVTSLSFTNREDLIPASVVFYYERDYDFNGNLTTQTEVQAYPLIGPFAGPGVVTATIPLRGASRTVQEVRIHSDALPTGSTSAGGANQDLETFWKRKLPWLADFDQARWIVDDHTVVVDEQGTRPPSLLNGDPIVIDTDTALYPRELINGGIEEWMNVKTAELLITATIALDENPTAEERKVFTDQIRIGGKTHLAYKANIRLTGTDALNQIYRNVVSATAAEATPVGLAEAYYNNLQGPHYEGSLQLMEPEGSVTAGLTVGATLDVDVDGAGAITDAVIQEVTEEVKDGAVIQSIVFGPPEHLSPQDFLERLRMARAFPKSTVTFEERTTGAATGEATATAPHDTAKSNSTVKPSIPIDIDTGFNVTQLGDETIQVGPGLITEDGNIEHILTLSPDTRAISGTETLWAIANTDSGGGITSTSIEWGAKPTGLQKHREPETNDAEDTGQTGKYTWRILDATNDSGIITVVPSRSGIEYYSDRSAKNWEDEDSISTGDPLDPNAPNVPNINPIPQGGSGGDGDGGILDNKGGPERHGQGIRVNRWDPWANGGAGDHVDRDITEDPQVEVPTDANPPAGKGHVLTEKMPPVLKILPADPEPSVIDGVWLYRDGTGGADGTWKEGIDGAWESRSAAPKGIMGWSEHQPYITEGVGTPDLDGRQLYDIHIDSATDQAYEVRPPELINGVLNERRWSSIDRPAWMGKRYTGSTDPGVDISVTEATGVINATVKIEPSTHGYTNQIAVHPTGGGFDVEPQTVTFNDASSLLTVEDGGSVTIPRLTPQGDWSDASVDYEYRDTAIHNGAVYHCLLDHNSATAATEPGVGASWETYWAIFVPADLSAPVDSVNGQTGVILLDLDDIAETATRKHLTVAERADIAANTADRHTDNANRAILDTIIDTGDGTKYLGNDALYHKPPGNSYDIAFTPATGVFDLKEDGAVINSVTIPDKDTTYAVTWDGLNRNLTVAPSDAASYDLNIPFGDAGDIVETADRKWLSSTERENIDSNTADRHTNNANRALLDTLIDSGDGTSYLGNDGAYTVPPDTTYDIAFTPATGAFDFRENGVTITSIVIPDENTTYGIGWNSLTRELTLTSSDDPDQDVTIADTTYALAYNTLLREVSLTPSSGPVQSFDLPDDQDTLYDIAFTPGTGAFDLKEDGVTKTSITIPDTTYDIAFTPGTGAFDFRENGITITSIVIPNDDTTYAFTWDSTTRDLTVDPSDAASYDLNIPFGDADDIAETVSRKWLTTAEQAKIAIIDDTGGGSNYLDDAGDYSVIGAGSILESATKVFVTPQQKLLIDLLDDQGGGGLFLGDDGNYAAPPDTLYDIAFTPGTGAFDLREDGVTKTSIVIPDTTYDIAFTPATGAFDFRENGLTITSINIPDTKYDIAYSPGTGAFDFRENGSTITSITIPDTNTEYTVTWDSTTRNLTVDPSDAASYDLNIPFGDADDIAETASRKWLSSLERSQIVTNTANEHTHSNKTLLDTITDAGDGGNYLSAAGNYTEPPNTTYTYSFNSTTRLLTATPSEGSNQTVTIDDTTYSFSFNSTTRRLTVTPSVGSPIVLDLT